MTGTRRQRASSQRSWLLSYPLSASRAVARSAWPPRHRRYSINQVEGLADVVDVPTGGDHLQRDATAVADQMMLRAWVGTVDRGRSDPGAPFLARSWAASATARDQSIAPAACSSASRSRCNRST